MALTRMRKRMAKDFIRASVRQMRKKGKRSAKPMESIGQEKIMSLQRNLENDLTMVNKEV